MTSMDAIFQYAVKFVCGRADGEVLARGEYLTAVNVHNPTNKHIELGRSSLSPCLASGRVPYQSSLRHDSVQTKHWKLTAPTSANELATQQISLRDLSSSRAMSSWTWWLCTRQLGRIERLRRYTSSECHHAVGKCCRVPTASTYASM